MSEQDVKALREAAEFYQNKIAKSFDERDNCARALAILCRAEADRMACEEKHGGIYDPEPTVQCDATYRLGWNAAIEAAKQACRCHAGKDGECYWEQCPQIRDGEPMKSARYCPYDNYCNDESCDAPNKIQTAISALRREPS